LRTADQRKDEFIAMMAHELRNPLAPISNIVQMMRSQELDAKTLAWAHDVLDRQLRNVGRMVNDLLDVSRIRHDKIQLHRERVALHDVVNRAVDALRSTIDAGQDGAANSSCGCRSRTGRRTQSRGAPSRGVVRSGSWSSTTTSMPPTRWPRCCARTSTP